MLPGPVLNVDATVICERPRLGRHRAEMEAICGEVLSAPVSVKATTNEGMGSIGRGEGIACIAVAMVELTGARVNRLPADGYRSTSRSPLARLGRSRSAGPLGPLTDVPSTPNVLARRA